MIRSFSDLAVIIAGGKNQEEQQGRERLNTEVYKKDISQPELLVDHPTIHNNPISCFCEQCFLLLPGISIPHWFWEGFQQVLHKCKSCICCCIFFSVDIYLMLWSWPTHLTVSPRSWKHDHWCCYGWTAILYFVVHTVLCGTANLGMLEGRENRYILPTVTVKNSPFTLTLLVTGVVF